MALGERLKRQKEKKMQGLSDEPPVSLCQPLIPPAEIRRSSVQEGAEADTPLPA